MVITAVLLNLGTRCFRGPRLLDRARDTGYDTLCSGARHLDLEQIRHQSRKAVENRNLPPCYFSIEKVLTSQTSNTDAHP